MTFRARQHIGKYRIEKKLGEGGFAVVYRALDTIEGVRVALKVPHPSLVNTEYLDDFRKEVRMVAKLDHPNILPLKYAGFLGSHFIMAFRLGEKSLADRLQSRMSIQTALDFTEQLLAAVAYAHEHRIIHCDIKPENLILFSANRLRLTDFGIARVGLRTIQASGSGTLGYIAPEQAMGRPSFRSDVFSCGLLMYRMFSGRLPEWPFEWPPPGCTRLRARTHPDLIAVIRRSTELEPRRRFRDAGQLLKAVRRVKTRAQRYTPRSSRGAIRRTNKRTWQTVQRAQFKREYGKLLETHQKCVRCDGPVAETMRACPWCGRPRKVHPEETRFPATCRRCHRGMKLDWKYCAWCYGAGFDPLSKREYPDVRYVGRCSNSRCARKVLMPFMRYCPWCRHRVKRQWKIPGSKEQCRSCKWGVLRNFWTFCPWCGKSLRKQ